MAGLNEAEERVDDGLMSLDFNKICRLCLNFCRDYVDLRPSNGTRNEPHHIIDQIKYCYSIKIDLSEPLPSKVCLQCIQIVTLFSATKRNIKYSEMMLKNILIIRDANHMINTQSREGANLTALQRYLQSKNNPRQQEPPVAQERPTQDNSNLPNLRISPIPITAIQELYRMQDQTIQNDNNQNILTKPNQSRSSKEHTERKNIENRKRIIENVKVVEKKPVVIKQDNSINTNSNSVESSSNKPSCSSIIDSKPLEKNVCVTTKTVEEDKMKSTNKKPNLVNNINKKKPYEIDLKRDLRVKLEVLDLKNTKFFCPPSTGGPSGSTEGQNGGTSSESKSGKAGKVIGTSIDESNILSPKVKRMRKSKPKG